MSQLFFTNPDVCPHSQAGFSTMSAVALQPMMLSEKMFSTAVRRFESVQPESLLATGKPGTPHSPQPKDVLSAPQRRDESIEASRHFSQIHNEGSSFHK